MALTGAGCTKLGTGGGHGNKWSTVEYSVDGSGQAEVRYAAKATEQMTTRQGAKLPFSTTVRTIDHSRTIYRVVAKHATSPLSCKITVNGVVVIRESAPAGKPVTCSFTK